MVDKKYSGFYSLRFVAQFRGLFLCFVKKKLKMWWGWGTQTTSHDWYQIPGGGKLRMQKGRSRFISIQCEGHVSKMEPWPMPLSCWFLTGRYLKRTEFQGYHGHDYKSHSYIRWLLRPFRCASITLRLTFKWMMSFSIWEGKENV